MLCGKKKRVTDEPADQYLDELVANWPRWSPEQRNQVVTLLRPLQGQEPAEDDQPEPLPKAA